MKINALADAVDCMRAFHNKFVLENFWNITIKAPEQRCWGKRNKNAKIILGYRNFKDRMVFVNPRIKYSTTIKKHEEECSYSNDSDQEGMESSTFWLKFTTQFYGLKLVGNKSGLRNRGKKEVQEFTFYK